MSLLQILSELNYTQGMSGCQDRYDEDLLKYRNFAARVGSNRKVAHYSDQDIIFKLCDMVHAGRVEVRHLQAEILARDVGIPVEEVSNMGAFS